MSTWKMYLLLIIGFLKLFIKKYLEMFKRFLPFKLRTVNFFKNSNLLQLSFSHDHRLHKSNIILPLPNQIKTSTSAVKNSIPQQHKCNNVALTQNGATCDTNVPLNDNDEEH